MLKLFVSTDKAVYPISAMGLSRADGEIDDCKSRVTDPSKTLICATRYGNVMASRICYHFC